MAALFPVFNHMKRQECSNWFLRKNNRCFAGGGLQWSLPPLCIKEKNIYICTRNRIEPWCNGNTADFGSVILGSNPDGSTDYPFPQGDGFFTPPAIKPNQSLIQAVKRSLQPSLPDGMMILKRYFTRRMVLWNLEI